MKYFATTLEHILAELERIDLLIQFRVWQLRQIQTVDASFQGLYISEQQIDELLNQPIGQPRWATVTDFPTAVDTALNKITKVIDQCKSESLKRGICLRLEKLVHLFQLSSIDVDILLICLAVELDLRYERFYAYLQDDVTKKRPTIDLVLNLLSPSLQGKLAIRQRLSPHFPLLKHRIIKLSSDPASPHQSLLSQFLQIEQRIVNYLLDNDNLETQLLPYTECRTPQSNWEDLILPTQFKEHLKRLTEFQTPRSIFYFQGNSGVGKRATAEAICQQLKMRLVIVDVKRLTREDTLSENTIHLLFREALLQNAALYWQDFDVLIAQGKSNWQEILSEYIASYSLLVFLSGENQIQLTIAQIPCITVKFADPSINERIQLWQKFLYDRSVESSETDLLELASKFRFSGGQIKEAIATAHNLANWRDPQNPQITLTDCYTACRFQSNQQLGTLARKIKPHYIWNDIVLPPEPLQQLREICGYVKHRAIVYEQWGFDRKLALGKGLSVLFSGSSGTGKTMAANVMAGELGLDLYQIDLSAVVSKYIGETEKNLAQIFREAETSNAILFFDEADALFGKRSEVKDAHDRHANIETSYLLQRMEEYEGIVILASNFRKNMDEAFVRRLHFIVDFPFPNERHRCQIWKKIFPTTTPVSTDLNLDFLASRFELSGGNIRNIALAAAFLAAEDEAVVKKIHLVRAIKRECQKMGRLLADKEFEEYLD